MTPTPILFSNHASPAIAEISREAIAKLAAAPHVFGCSHVVLGHEQAFMCAQHPLVGLMCVRCQRRHCKRHDRNFEFTCDHCGTQVPEKPGIYPVVSSAFGFAIVRTPDGYKRLHDEAITVTGIGVCGDCRAELAAVST